MRGLSAWFAARCRNARAWLIDRDPIGVVQYGDVSNFANEEKRSLLGALERNLPMQGFEFGLAARLRAMATPGMETAFKHVLSSPSRDPERQQFVGLLLQPLIDGACMPGLSESLLGVVRDSTWRSSVRLRALEAYCQGSHGGGKLRELRELFDDFRRGNVADPDDELLGIVLEQLYPLELPPPSCGNCSLPDPRPRTVGADTRGSGERSSWSFLPIPISGHISTTSAAYPMTSTRIWITVASAVPTLDFSLALSLFTATQ